MKRLFREISAALLVLALLLAPMPSAAQYTGSATGGGAGASAWGAITGTLSNQTDLNTALGGKAALVGGNSFTGGTNSFSGNLTNVQSAGTQLLVQGTTGSTDPAFVMDSGNVADFMYFRLGGVEQAQVTVTNGTITYWVNSHIFNTHGGTRLLSLDSTAVNIGTGVPLQNNGTTILSGSGVLQAAGVPAFAGGDVTSAGGSLVLTIPNGTVTLAKQANMATSSLIYRKTAGSGVPEVNTLATLKTDLGLTGTNSGDQTITLTSDVTGTGTGSFATTIAANVVNYAKFQQVAASSLVGNPTGSLANAQGITLAGGLGFSGTTLTAAGALTPTSVASSGAISGTSIAGTTTILSSGATSGVGYATGAGGAVTQITSRTTGVTNNKACGAVPRGTCEMCLTGLRD
jgi:hypothetical protein